MAGNSRLILNGVVALGLLMPYGAAVLGQAADDRVTPLTTGIAALGLSEEKAARMKSALATSDYIEAERLLLEAIAVDPHSERAGRLLAYTGSIYFLNKDYAGAAIAWKKSETIHPLEPSLEFSLAMSYVAMGHQDWARRQLETLRAQRPTEALYPYWLGRLDYDAHQYESAILRFNEAILLNPAMARAYDNLGLCYFYRNENVQAVESYKKAIELDRALAHPPAQPYLNLGNTLQFLGKSREAETALRMAIALEPKSAVAHFQLGSVLEDLDQPQGALPELVESVRLDPKYAEPHLALSHIYKRLGKADLANQEVLEYRRLRVGGGTSVEGRTAEKP